MSPAPLLWFWRGLRGHSITFALLFASVILGASIAGGLHRLLASLGIHWLYVLILPIFIFGYLAKHEPSWVTDEKLRRRIARSLLFGSIAVVLLVSWLKRH